MATFEYIAYTKDGKRVKGFIEAPSASIALSLLKRKGIYPKDLSLISKRQRRSLRELYYRVFRGVSDAERADAFFQLATLVASGVPLADALGIVSEEVSNPLLKLALKSVRDNVVEGRKFSEAMYDHVDIFKEVYVNMIRVAEDTGNLGDMLFKIALKEEERSAFGQKIISSMIYPVFVMSVGFLVVMFLLAYVVPKLEKIFNSMHQSLPFVTRLLISIGNFLKGYAMVILMFLLVAALIMRWLTKKSRLRKMLDSVLVRLSLYRQYAVAQFVSMFSFQLDAGIPLVEAIRNSASAVANSVFRDALETVADLVEEGVSVEDAFKRAGLFDSIFIASVTIGKKSGNLSVFMNRMSEYYERKLSKVIDSFVQIIEPASILLLGVIVGFIVVSVMVPIFSMSQMVR